MDTSHFMDHLKLLACTQMYNNIFMYTHPGRYVVSADSKGIVNVNDIAIVIGSSVND